MDKNYILDIFEQKRRDDRLIKYGDLIDEETIDILLKANKRIAELESELAVKEDLLKIKNGLYSEKSVIEILKNTPFVEDVLDEEPLPFSCDKCEEETKTELPTMPIDVASMLINARDGISDKYSKDDLQEIIKHLRAFIDNKSYD